MVTIRLLAALWGGMVLVLAGILGRRAPSKWRELGALCVFGLLVARLWWPHHAGMVAGVWLAMAGWLAIAGRPRRGAGLLYAALGASVGALLYWGSEGGGIGLMLGLALSLACHLGLREPKPPVTVHVPRYQQHLFVCQGSACRAKGSQLLMDAMRRSPAFRARQGVRVTAVRCLGRCARAPVILKEPKGIWAASVKLRDIAALPRGEGSGEN
ncbi:(2Fe-2S) ferredoxin domain-containing protein [Sulfobacillus harzensis]|uniref:(2Fe-2S) ferredoxin domain-containing protein n=1 Tax=Sulfobacillus harzensis TaxID=2729629 RepID=A0A7Y0L0W8_9FIRM|nr:(2Fe-2S) ferredoxin domain-containing protein [Sulfobacillus harzensis]NMP21237.1 (2Fe-2S) ferredoxin domain-containing protein [Sulfobacillus harzensis]